MILVLDRTNVAIGTYALPVSTSNVVVQLGRYRAMDRISPLELEHLHINGIWVLRIKGETPPDLFHHEEFLEWNGPGHCSLT